MNKKVVLITGASRGIGKSIAILLAEKGYTVIANYNKSEQKALELKHNYKNIDIFQADVSKREEVKSLVNYTLKKYGKIDVLINNAGIDIFKMFQDISDEDWNKILNTNLYSAFCATQEVLPNMISNKSRMYNKYIINLGLSWSIM